MIGMKLCLEASIGVELMRKVKEVWYCDRCHVELEENDLHDINDYLYGYELCEDCAKLHKEYKRAIDELDKKIDQISREYKFGRYLPREDENEEEK